MGTPRRALLALALAALLITAGCAGPPAPSNAPSGVATTDSRTATATPARSAAGEPGTPTPARRTTRASTDPLPENPWRSQAVRVAVGSTADGSRNYTALVRAAMRYWNGNVTEYTPYNVTLVCAGGGERADVVVRFVETIPATGANRSDLLGLSPVVEPGTVARGTQTIYVAEGYTATSTVQVLKHEFGHYLGLDHGDRPQPLMSPTYPARTMLRPNASMRLLAWQTHALAVSIEVHGMNETAVRSQVRHALGYYERGAAGWLGTNVTLRLVNGSSAADVHVRVYDHTSRTGMLAEHGSIATVYGMDPDGDGALEYFTNATIVVGGVETEAVGWHVGYWLAYALRGQVGTDVPEAFDDPTDSRRDDWWE